MNLVFTTNQTQRLDIFLRSELPSKIGQECSNSKIRRLILASCVSVNGRPVIRPSFELRGQSKILVNFDKEKFFYEKQPDDIKYELTDKDLIFENEDLIFINKPAFFPVEQTIVGNRDNLHDALVRYLWARNPSLRNPPYAGIMHRLDRETSGIILFTKNRAVNKEVQAMFADHNFTKIYQCLVTSQKKLEEGYKFTVEMYMGRISGKSQAGKWGRLDEAKGGQYSKTDFRVLKKLKHAGQECYLLEATLYTGRTHQIRVHLADRGLPILGDTLYGGKESERIWLHSSRFAGMGLELECPFQPN